MKSRDAAEARRARRAAKRRRSVVRRRGALVIALGAVLAVIAVLTLIDEGGSRRVRGGAGAKSAPAHHRSQLVRNARPQPGWRTHRGPVPILVYHALGNPPPSEEYPGLYVSDREFREEMAWLHGAGYEGVTLDQVERAWYHGGTLPARPIVITFDNGYPEQVTFAPKVLSGYGWPGVLFEITEEHLRPPEIRPIVAKGWEVDSHSATHPDLTQLSGAELEYEVAASRRYLRRKFGVASDNFCYPSSEYDAATIAAVKEAGYVGAVTENAGYASREKPYELDRYEIEGGQGVEGLAADLQSQ